MPYSFIIRLRIEMEHVTLKQKLVAVQADLTAMVGWAQRKQDDSNRQGTLDHKYVKDRYDRGVNAVANFCSSKHHIVAQEDFGGTHQEVVQFMHGLTETEQPWPDY